MVLGLGVNYKVNLGLSKLQILVLLILFQINGPYLGDGIAPKMGLTLNGTRLGDVVCRIDWLQTTLVVQLQ